MLHGILETEMWRLPVGNNNINPVLRLSYHNLPSIQKRCFAYCSIFPKGHHLFTKRTLIRIWMAEGLLKCCGQEKSEEELGNEYFGDLESISFFQPSTHDDDYFVMHDLLNDLAKSMSEEFCMRIDAYNAEGISERTRHILWSLPLNGTCVDKIPEQIFELKGLRSLLLNGYQRMLISNTVQRDMFSRLKYLRMLSLYNCIISEVVDEISNLKLLRYLDLSLTGISRLPDTICMLTNLQTLLLWGCSKLTELPSNFSKLVSLRHLHLPLTIKKMPKHIGSLSNLQTLTFFIVKEQNITDLKELEKLNHLHGRLHIKGLGNVIDPLDVATRILKDKKYLEVIEMTFDGRREDVDGSIVESNVSLLEALHPNRNLKMLIIREYRGNIFPNWLKGCHLPNLVYLNLDYCGLCSHLPLLGQLPSLKELSISNCHGIKIFGKEFYSNNFKSLEILRFEKMGNWEEWLCIEGFPQLKKLYIKYCPKLKSTLPLQLPSLQRLVIQDCPKLIASREELGLFQFNSLNKFIVSDDSMESFPEENLLPPTLKYLCLQYCSKLRIINYKGFLHLKSLSHLSIWSCPSLECLPEESLPNSLETLEISECPLLKEKYKKEGGERWHTISHIPSMLIE